jgi:histone H4
MAKGRTGKGKTKGKGKRTKGPSRPTIEGITKPAIRRLARKAGVRRVAFDIYAYTQSALKHWLEGVVRDALTYTEHARRKTVKAMDVVHALKRRGQAMYGFGM